MSFVLVAAQLFHSVLDSVPRFAGLFSGRATYTWADWARALGWSGLGNIIGGVGLVTSIRLLRVPHLVRGERASQHSRHDPVAQYHSGHGVPGWPAEAIDFYDGLEEDNSRAYWQAHKAVYDDARPAPDGRAAVRAPAAQFGPGRILRPDRDVRFSADKSPYKTAIGARLGRGRVHPAIRGLPWPPGAECT